MPTVDLCWWHIRWVSWTHLKSESNYKEKSTSKRKSTFCYSRLTLSINQLFATPSQLCHKSQKGKSTFCYSRSILSIHQLFYNSRSATRLLSGMIKGEAS